MNKLYNPFRKKVSPKHTFLSREQLRKLARMNNVRRGRNTRDTINNLKAAGIIV